MDFAGRKSAAKFLCVKTVSGKVVGHSWPIYPCTNGWWGCPLYPKFSTKVTHPVQMAISTVRFDFEGASLFTPCLPYPLNARMSHFSVQYVFPGAYE